VPVLSATQPCCLFDAADCIVANNDLVHSCRQKKNARAPVPEVYFFAGTWKKRTYAIAGPDMQVSAYQVVNPFYGAWPFELKGTAEDQTRTLCKSGYDRLCGA